MAHRLVSRTETIRTAADAQAFIIRDTGGAVVPTGQTQEVSGGWSCECYSTDGIAPPTASGRILLKVISVADDGKSARVQDQSGFSFDVPRNVPAFLPLFPGETIALQPGQTISCEIENGTQDGLKDVVIESELRERREFGGAQQQGPFWTPGIATGDGFSKQ